MVRSHLPLALRSLGLGRNRLIQNNRRGQVVAEGLEVLQRPNDLLVAVDLDQLGILGPGVRVAEDDVAIGELGE